jgi:ubiquinone/menaquinone biosynthesis C-methylase UbiE
MGQDLRRIEKTYDALAEEYAREFIGEHAKKPMDREMLRRFAREIGDRRPVWDFGCGPGQTAEYLRILGLTISGLDLSEKTLEQARKIHPGLHFRKGNMLELPFDSDSIAGVVNFYAIVHFTKGQVASAFREIFRVLQPGGLLLLAFHIGKETIHLDEYLEKPVDIDFMFFTTEYISGCLEKVGFEKIEIIEREPYTEVEYPSRRAYVFAEKPLDAKSRLKR